MLEDVSADRINAGQVGTRLGNMLSEFGTVRRSELIDRLRAASNPDLP